MFGKNYIKIDGYYRARKKGFSESTNSEYDIYYVLKFNSHGLVAFLESENEPIHPSFDELSEFDTTEEYEEFCGITRYSLKGDELVITLYQPDDHNAYENGLVNKENYFEWVGSIRDENTLSLSFRKSYYNYALMDYTIDYIFKDLEFYFLGVV